MYRVHLAGECNRIIACVHSADYCYHCLVQTMHISRMYHCVPFDRDHTKQASRVQQWTNVTLHNGPHTPLNQSTLSRIHTLNIQCTQSHTCTHKHMHIHTLTCTHTHACTPTHTHNHSKHVCTYLHSLSMAVRPRERMLHLVATDTTEES